MKKTVVLGVTSGIAAFKSVELVKLLRKQEIEVFVIMTKTATQMISPKEFEKATGNTVYTELFDKDFDYKDILKIRTVDHIDLADKASVFVISPATANVIAKIAHGIADDFLTTTILATQAPIILCPSMNVHMWENPSVQENINILKKRGFIIIDPEEGALACGYEGKGRLADIEKVATVVEKLGVKRKVLQGKRIVVTSGATREPIDDIRFITNKSSGKMGLALAQEAFLLGAQVTLLRAAHSASAHFPIREEIFETGADLEKLLQKHISDCDIVFHTAAVGDFTIPKKSNGKLSSDSLHELRLIPQQKIMSTIKKNNLKVMLIGFKAQWGGSKKDMIAVGKKKLIESNADAIVVNDVSKKTTGFAVDTNEVIVVRKDGSSKEIPFGTKEKVAQGIINCLFGKV